MKLQNRSTLVVLCALLVCALATPLSILAQSATGRIAGVVYNAQSESVLRSATIEIVETKATAHSGVDGDFAIEVPPGHYTLRVSSEKFTPQTVEVDVEAGKTADQPIVLVPAGLDESIQVQGGADNDTIAAVYEERKASASISDVVGREQIAEDTRSTTAGVIVRVPGITVSEGGNVIARGMDPRYSQQLLNGATMPTPDPERKQLSMELVPAKLLQSAAILKSFTPDQPGEFAGGLVRLETVEMPSQTTLSMSYSIGYNSSTTGKPFLTSGGGGPDFFGFGAGSRHLPDAVPTGERLLPGNPYVPGGFTRDELQAFGRSFDNSFTPESTNARPAQSWNVAAARRFGRIGIVGAVGFKNDLETIDEQRNFYTVDSTGDLTRQTSYDYRSGTTVARLGGTTNVSYELNGNNKLFFKNFYSNQASNEARTFQGFNDDRATDLRNTRLRYVEEQLYSGQLSGRHTLPWISDGLLAWRYTYSRATLDEPDLREALYEYSPVVHDFVYLSQNQSLFHLFNDMKENMREPAADVTKLWLARGATVTAVGSSRVDLQACKLEYSIVSPK